MIGIDVEDPDDPRLSDFTDLKDPAARTRREVQGGFFVAESLLVIERLLSSPLRIRSLFLTPRNLERLLPQLEGRDVTVFVAGPHLMERVVGFDLHRGALASAERPVPLPVTDAVSGAPLVAVLEGLNDHENLGAIFRSAAGLGVGAMVLDPTCADPWYRRSVRVSMGTVLDLPIARAESMPDALALLRALGYRLVALTLSDRATPLSSVPPDPPTAVVLGAEGPGLKRDSIIACDVEATIPMRGGVDSLNVGHAAAVAFHHFGSAR